MLDIRSDQLLSLQGVPQNNTASDNFDMLTISQTCPKNNWTITPLPPFPFPCELLGGS